jgi:hypothetical protein
VIGGLPSRNVRRDESRSDAFCRDLARLVATAQPSYTIDMTEFFDWPLHWPTIRSQFLTIAPTLGPRNYASAATQRILINGKSLTSYGISKDVLRRKLSDDALGSTEMAKALGGLFPPIFWFFAKRCATLTV